LSYAGSEQLEDLVRYPPGLTQTVGEDPLGCRSHHECIVCRHGGIRRRTARENHVACQYRFPIHEVPPIDARTAGLTQPGNDAQEVSRKRRFQEHNLMPPSHEYAAQSLQPLQIETEEGRMVDCGLFQVIEIRRVVDVTEGIDLMESDPKKGFERRDPGIRE
jgi:hypothetical protein